MPLTRPDLRALRADAHVIHPTLDVKAGPVDDGSRGELSRQLDARGLVKVRFSSKDRVERKAQMAALAADCGAEIVLSIGKIASFWRGQTETQTLRDSE